MTRINISDIEQIAKELRAGESVLLTGYIYTARDAAHKKIKQLADNNESLPFDIRNSVIYYAGPTPAPDGFVIGSCGPTTSGRMDPFTPMLLDLGLKAMIGKGERSGEVIDSIKKNKAVYFCAVGGAGALLGSCIKSVEVIAFDELGCESIKKMYIEDFPAIVAIDSEGNNIFKTT